jgi:hypothetical protein
VRSFSAAVDVREYPPPHPFADDVVQDLYSQRLDWGGGVIADEFAENVITNMEEEGKAPNAMHSEEGEEGEPPP